MPEPHHTIWHDAFEGGAGSSSEGPQSGEPTGSDGPTDQTTGEAGYRGQIISSVWTRGEDRLPFGPNWLVYLLPYLEKNALYQQANVSSYPGDIDPKSKEDYPNYNVDWRGIRSTPVKLFVCPADDGHDTPFSPKTPNQTEPASDKPDYSDPAFTANYPGAGWARGNYAANAGPGSWAASAWGESKKYKYYMPGTYEDYGGVMCINYGAKLGSLTKEDGTSNTVMLNEVRVGVNQYDRRGVWALGFPGSSVTAYHANIYFNRGPNERGDNRYAGAENVTSESQQADNPENSGTGDMILDCRVVLGGTIGEEVYALNEAEDAAYEELLADAMGCDFHIWIPPEVKNYPNVSGQARSRHPGGVNVTMADGSVRFVRDTINTLIWFRMNSRNDGRIYYYEF